MSTSVTVWLNEVPRMELSGQGIQAWVEDGTSLVIGSEDAGAEGNHEGHKTYMEDRCYGCACPEGVTT